MARLRIEIDLDHAALTHTQYATKAMRHCESMLPGSVSFLVSLGRLPRWPSPS